MIKSEFEDLFGGCKFYLDVIIFNKVGVKRRRKVVKKKERKEGKKSRGKIASQEKLK